MEKTQGRDTIVGGYSRAELGTYALAYAVLTGRDVRTSIDEVVQHAERPSEVELFRIPNRGWNWVR